MGPKGRVILFLVQAFKLPYPLVRRPCHLKSWPLIKVTMQGMGLYHHLGFPEFRLQGTWALGEQVLVKETGGQHPGAPNLSSFFVGVLFPIRPHNGTASQPSGHGICQ